MTETDQAAQDQEKAPEESPARRMLTPAQLQALAREVLRLMRDELRVDLERRGREGGKPRERT